jgi:hypothetical protein
LALLAIACVLSVGIVLVAVVGVGVAALVQHLRKRRYTRRAGWLGAVLGAAVASAAAIMFFATRVPPGTFEEARARAIAEQQQHPPRVSRFLERVVSRDPSSAAMQARTQAWLSKSRVFWWYIVILGGTLACAMIGLFFGTPAWWGVLLIQFGVTGRWPPRTSSMEPESPL